MVSNNGVLLSKKGDKMRKIKFRAWDKKYKQMCYEDCAFPHICLDGTWCEIDYANEKEGMASDNLNVNIMLFTGFKDLEGKEIYEGDIVEDAQKEIREVGFGVITDYEDNVPIGYGYHYDMVQDCIVIGNIYENPKLLK